MNKENMIFLKTQALRDVNNLSKLGEEYISRNGDLEVANMLKDRDLYYYIPYCLGLMNKGSKTMKELGKKFLVANINKDNMTTFKQTLRHQIARNNYNYDCVDLAVKLFSPRELEGLTASLLKRQNIFPITVMLAQSDEILNKSKKNSAGAICLDNITDMLVDYMQDFAADFEARSDEQCYQNGIYLKTCFETLIENNKHGEVDERLTDAVKEINDMTKEYDGLCFVNVKKEKENYKKIYRNIGNPADPRLSVAAFMRAYRRIDGDQERERELVPQH